MDGDIQCDFASDCEAAVILERLGEVLDPELDESILELGFIRSLKVCDGRATVTLRLPTSWCGANFAYAMAEDIRRALFGVDGIDSVTVWLGDHFAGEKIEAAVNGGKPFAEAFHAEGGGSLEPLRGLFSQKGFTCRQERLLRDLMRSGFSPEEICALRVGDIFLEGDTCMVRRSGDRAIRLAPAETARRYLERRTQVGLDDSASAMLIVDFNGRPLSGRRFKAYLEAARMVRISMESNGLFCRAVLAQRQRALKI